MRAAVTKTEHDVVAMQQFADGVQGVVLQVAEGDQQHGVAVVVEQPVVGLLPRVDPAGPGPGTDAV